MEDLTTPQEEVDVNEPETSETKEEPQEAEEQPGEETQVEEQTTEYDDAWDKIDLDNENLDEFFQAEEATTEPEDEVQVEEPEEEAQAPGSGAIVIDNPVLKFKGKEVPVESAEELINLAQKGLKLEIEMSKIKPQKRMIQLIESAGIDEEHLKALADVMSGKKEALDYLASKAGIEVERDNLFEEEDGSSKGYEPQVEPEDAVKEFWDEFSKTEPQVAAKVIETYDDLDESFKAEIYKPGVFQAFVGSVQTGEFDQAYPIAIKLKATNPAMSWLQAYAAAAQRIGSRNEPEQFREPPAAVRTKKTSVRQDRAAKGRDIEDRIWNDDRTAEELFDKLFS